MASQGLIVAHQLSIRKGFLFAHVNIRSIVNKIDLVRILIDQCKIDCLCLTETIRWERPNTNKYTRGGGVCTYICDSCDAEIIKCPVNPDRDLEFICANVSRNYSPSITCITVYQPPKGNTRNALQKLRAICDYASSLKG